MPLQLRATEGVYIWKTVLGRKGSYLRDVAQCLLLLTLVIFPLWYSTFFSSLCSSLPTKRGWHKQMDRPIRKAGLTHFHFAGLQLVYRNFCCELYFRSSPKLLFFASDSPRSPFLPDGFQCDTVAHTDETPCCLTLPRAGCGRCTWNIDIYQPLSRAHKTHCQCCTLLWRWFLSLFQLWY